MYSYEKKIARVLLFAGALFSPGTSAPAYSQAPLQFDAATVKLDKMGPYDQSMKGGPGTDSPGRITWRGAWLWWMLATAFGMEERRVFGPPSITGPNRQLYSFTATMPPTTSRQDFERMFQAFLIEQFKIKLHHETRQFPAYDLVVAQGGPKLKASADPNAPDNPILTKPDIGSDGFPISPPGHSIRVAMIAGYHARFQNCKVSELAERIMGWITPRGEPTRYVVDKTGLTGVYDFTLKFDDGGAGIAMSPAVQAAVMSAQNGSDPGSGLPNIFKALEQQLGLKLVKGKDISLDTILVDSAERIPVGN